MSDNPDYVREIEKYFLSLAGEGIMLSSMDYSLIQSWKKKNVPRELVLKGIQKAFAESVIKSKGGKGPPRNLKQCAGYVDEYIADYRPQYHGSIEEETVSSGAGGIIEEISRALGSLISDLQKGVKLEYYRNLRHKILELDESGDENLFRKISEIEERLLDHYFDALPENVKAEINKEAQDMIEGRARHMTESAYTESLISFRNEIVCKRYGLRTINSILRD
jgi:hypothetical protein